MLDPAAPQGVSRPLRVGILAASAATKRRLTTFSAGLAEGLRACGAEVAVVEIAADCAHLLNLNDVAIIEHAFDVNDDDVLDLIDELRILTVVVIHTVPDKPNRRQRSELAVITTGADHVVAMSEASRERLCTMYGVERRKISTIPHGATIPSMPRVKRSRRPTILTWGWLGPGKGVERVIDAMASLRDAPGRPRYVIAGPTHPKAHAADGEAYREARIEQAQRAGVADSVVFDPHYYDGAMLTELIQQSSVVALPYDSTDQVTSGVLVQAIAHGRPVVATAFPHAVELLNTGAGVVVPHNDPAALATAVRQILTRPWLAGEMAAEARRLAPQLEWSEVAGGHIRVAQHLLARSRASL
ncbi:glycosyltransferase [Mycolicibacterium sp. XJ1819]